MRGREAHSPFLKEMGWVPDRPRAVLTSLPSTVLLALHCLSHAYRHPSSQHVSSPTAGSKCMHGAQNTQ